MAKRITVEQWISEACQDADKGGACSAISLVHVKNGGVGTEEVHTKPLEGPQNYRQLAEFFINKACGFAQDLTGIQSFRLQAHYVGRNEPQASFTFTVFEGSLTAGESAPWSKHEPTATGALALCMKNMEFMMSQYTQLTQGFTGMLIQRDIAHQNEKAEMNLVMRDILLNLRKEDQAAQMERLKFERESAERQMIGRALPSMMNYLTGREIVPESHADSQIIEALAMKVKPEQLQLLVASGICDQQTALLLAQRFAKVREEAEKRAQAVRLAPPEEPTNGKSDQLS